MIKYKDGSYAIHEVYYEKGKVKHWTENPVSFSGENKRELITSLAMAISGTKQRALSHEKLKKRAK